MDMTDKTPLIIIGGMKCGTTSLRKYLDAQDFIFFGASEGHYFNKIGKPNREGYFNHLISFEAYDGEALIGDDTPTYSFDANVPDKISEICPDAKLIFVVRDPVKRAVSNYWHAVRRGAESRAIDKAFSDCLDGTNSNIWLDYVERSRYSVQYERYLKYFRKEQIHLTSLEGLLSNFESEKMRLNEFLGQKLSGDKLPKVNARSFHARHQVNLFFGSWCNSNLVTKAVGLILRKIISHSNQQVPVLDNTLKLKCEQYLASEYAFLERVRNFEQ